MDRVEDLAAEMRTAGMTLDDHMLYTIFIDALLAEYEVEARNLASRDSIGRDDIIEAVREGHHRLFGSRKKGPMLVMPAMLCSPAAAVVAAEKGPAAVPMGKVEAAVKEKVDVGDSKDAAVKAPTRTVVAASASLGRGYRRRWQQRQSRRWWYLRGEMSDKMGHWRVDCTEELCSRCHERGHAADVCPTSKEEAVLVASDDDDDYDTVKASAFKAEEAGECNDVLDRKGKEGVGLAGRG